MRTPFEEVDRQGRVRVEVVGQDHPLQARVQQIAPVAHPSGTRQSPSRAVQRAGVLIAQDLDVDPEPLAPYRQVQAHP